MQLCLLQLSIHSETAHFSKRSCRYARERSVVFLKLLINSQCSVKLRPREDLFFLPCFAFALPSLPLRVSVAEGEAVMLLITRRLHREGSQAVDLETGSDIFKPSTTS